MAAEAVRGPETEEHIFTPWKLVVNQSHILPSEGEERVTFEAQLKLPKLPEMVFASNRVRIESEMQPEAFIEFNALDALKQVDAENAPPVQVAPSKTWREARADCEFINKIERPFDWTFGTAYKGTLSAGLQASATTERINMEKLKEREKINFYVDLSLFEDELADNGCSWLNIRLRAMDSCFFALLRFYLRIDGVLMRVHDTRIYYERGAPFILRECSLREASWAELNVEKLSADSPGVLTDRDAIVPHLRLVQEVTEKIELLSS